MQPYTKKRPKSGHVHGLRNSPTTAPLRPTTPKPASGNERAIKKGGGGHPPATLCVRAFSRESLDPRPGPGGKPRGRVYPATVPTGQKKNSVEATVGRASLFYKERLGTKSPPHPTRLRRPTFPSRGRLWGVEAQRSGLETFFHKNAFQHSFPRKCVPNRS